MQGLLNFRGACTLVLWLSTAAAGAQSPELIVEIEKQDLYEGESVLYRVTLNHVENPTAPQLNGFDDFQVTPLGEQSLDSRQITIINGRRSEVIRRGRQYSYRLTPLKSGTLTIPAPTATVDQRVLTGQQVTVNVIAPEAQLDVILEMNADRPTVYPMQAVKVTLTIACRALPEPFETRDPLTVQSPPPALTVPWLDDQQIPDGLQPQQDWRAILEPLVSRRSHGVQVNNIGTTSVFSLFNDSATAFHPVPVQSERTGPDGETRRYWEYRFERTLIPRRIGTWSLGPATLKGTFASDVRQGQLVGQQRYVVAPAVQLTVRDVPSEGRPESYIGAVGTFDVQTQLAPLTAKVGDPMTLTLTITGQGTLEDARPPDLSRVPGLTDQFRLYDATQETQGQSRQFTYSLRPLHQNIDQFPSIPVSYFDVNSEAYRTLTTPDIPLTIQAAEALSAEDIVAASAAASDTSRRLQAREGGLFANHADVRTLRDQSIRPERWLITWISMTAGSLVLMLVISRVQRGRQDPLRQRRLRATHRARTMLEQAERAVASNETQSACIAARSAVTGLVADYLGLEQAGLTIRDVVDRLKVVTADAALQQKAQTFLEECDAARYGAANREAAALVTTARQLVAELQPALAGGQS